MKNNSHILVIRLSALGDVAMTVPVLRVVTQTYPELKITVLSRGLYAPLFHDISNLHFLEADVKEEHKGFFGLMKLAKAAKALHIDAVADLHNVIRSKIITKNLSLAGNQTATLDKGRAEKKKLTNAKGMGLVKLASTHERYAQVFEALGFPINLDNHRFPERKPLNPRLLNIVGKEPKKCIGIAPFAAYESKMYPLELMEEVISALEKTGYFQLLLFGGGKKEIASLTELSAKYPTITNVAGTLTFEEELHLISNLDLMLSMDSANGHLAAMYGIPVITLWGVTHPYAGFSPFQQPDHHQLLADRNQYPLIPTSVYGNKYPPGYENSMATIPPKKIVDKILEIL